MGILHVAKFLGVPQGHCQGWGKAESRGGAAACGESWGRGEPDEAARVSWGEGFYFEPHTEAVTPKGNLPRPGGPH